MLRFTLLILMLGFMSGLRAAEPPGGLAELRWLIGEWRGVGEGDSGTSASERSADSFLEGRYVRVSGRSVYPAQPENPKGETYGQLDIWSYDRARQSIVLRHFDTLGFVSTYVLDKAASSANRWVLVAESFENLPKEMKARYTYTRTGPNDYEEVLELDADGKGFKPYVSTRFRRIQAEASP